MSDRDIVKKQMTIVQKFRNQIKEKKRKSETAIEELQNQSTIIVNKRPRLLKVDGEIKQLQKELNDLKNSMREKPHKDQSTEIKKIASQIELCYSSLLDTFKAIEELQKKVKSGISSHQSMRKEFETLEKSIHEFYQDTTQRINEITQLKSVQPFEFRNLPTADETIRLEANKQLRNLIKDRLVVSMFNPVVNKPQPVKKKKEKPPVKRKRGPAKEK